MAHKQSGDPMTTKATKRPWTYIKSGNTDDHGTEVCYDIMLKSDGGDTLEYIGETATEEDAKLVIKAVNHHGALVRALEDMHTSYHPDCEMGCPYLATLTLARKKVTRAD